MSSLSLCTAPHLFWDRIICMRNGPHTSAMGLTPWNRCNGHTLWAMGGSLTKLQGLGLDCLNTPPYCNPPKPLYTRPSQPIQVPWLPTIIHNFVMPQVFHQEPLEGVLRQLWLGHLRKGALQDHTTEPHQMAQPDTIEGNQTPWINKIDTPTWELIPCQTWQPQIDSTLPNSEPENKLNQDTNAEREGQLDDEQWDHIPSSDGIQPDKQNTNPTPQPRPHKRGKKIHPGLKSVSLNIKGYGQTSQNSKWLHVNQLMREWQIGILAIQESHMDEAWQRETEDLFGRHLWILASADPTSLTQKSGIAIVLNKEFLNTKRIVQHEIEPGQAILVTITWSREVKLTVLAVYTPNPAEY